MAQAVAAALLFFLPSMPEEDAVQLLAAKRFLAGLPPA